MNLQRVQDFDDLAGCVTGRINIGQSSMESLALCANDFRHHLRTLDAESIRKIVIKAPAPQVSDHSVRVWIAGLLDYLAHKYKVQPPNWIESPEYFLDMPVYFGSHPELKEHLLAVTPSAWRRRLMFIGETSF